MGRDGLTTLRRPIDGGPLSSACRIPSRTQATIMRDLGGPFNPSAWGKIPRRRVPTSCLGVLPEPSIRQRRKHVPRGTREPLCLPGSVWNRLRSVRWRMPAENDPASQERVVAGQWIGLPEAYFLPVRLAVPVGVGVTRVGADRVSTASGRPSASRSAPPFGPARTKPAADLRPWDGSVVAVPWTRATIVREPE
jgi:hypothetical protein